MDHTSSRARVRAIATAAVISALTGCGSTGSGHASSEVGDAFAKRATAVCQKALNAKRAWAAFPVSNFDPTHPDPGAFPTVRVWLQSQVAPTFALWVHGLTSLGVPPSGHRAWSDTLAAVRSIVQGNQHQIAAAKHGDVGAFAAATHGLHDSQTQLERATAAAGVPKCADVHK